METTDLIINLPEYSINRKYTKFEVLVDIICLCKNGEIKTSYGELSKRYRWNKGSLFRLLENRSEFMVVSTSRGIDISLSNSKKRQTKATAKSLDDRRKSFYNSLIPFVEKYGAKMIRDFYDYWSETDNSKNPKMRFEKQKSWETDKRLLRWLKNADEFKEKCSTRLESNDIEETKMLKIKGIKGWN